MSGLRSCLYAGTVVHQRMRPKKHRLRYRVFSALLDLDELPVIDRQLQLFGHNRRAIYSFHDRDHGPGADRPLRSWVEGELAKAGIDLAGGAIRLLCYPRIAGYVFNPLSVYFCHEPGGGLRALLYEVNNTFGERHTYLIPVDADEDDAVVRQECDKAFYVSPFLAVAGRYRFRVTPPGELLSVGILQTAEDGAPLLHAQFDAARMPLDDRTLRQCFLRYPLLTLKVIGGIHIEALRLWWKGVPLIRRPPPPAQPVTIVAPRTKTA
ncbi:MAG TPA: DUF1365 domain-containing protein [Rhodospirillales bacterium]|nr:DUF1365 domain-containing protein [Rhodospirillales bacterium]